MKKNKSKYLVLAALAVCSINCVSIQAPPAPSTNALKSMAPAEREKIYQQNSIDYKGKGYVINSVQYSAGGIEHLFSAPFVSAKTKQLKSSFDSWDSAAGVTGFLMGLNIYGSAGFTGYWLFGTKSDPKYSSYVGIAWGAAAVWSIAYILTKRTSLNRMDAAAQGYNEDLLRSLDLQQKTSYNPVPMQEQYAHHSLSWTFRL